MDASFLHIEGPDEPDAHRRREHLRGSGSAVRGPRGDGRRASSASSRATARRSASSRSASAARSGWTTRTSTSPTTCATPRCRRRAATSSCANRRRGSSPSSLDRAQAAVGDLDGRRLEREPLGAALEGPPLHGRRRLGAPTCMTVMFDRTMRRRRDPPRWEPEPGAERRRARHAHAARTGRSTRPSSFAPCAAAARAARASRSRRPEEILRGMRLDRAVLRRRSAGRR